MEQTRAISVCNRQRQVSVNLKRLRSRVELATASIARVKAGIHSDAWSELSAIEVSIVSDAAIAKVHRRFLNDPASTDVITFQHGEILVSAGTAKREAAKRGWSVEEELLLYIVHGCLHLRGYDDHEVKDRRRMHEVQGEIWKSVCRR